MKVRHHAPGQLIQVQRDVGLVIAVQPSGRTDEAPTYLILWRGARLRKHVDGAISSGGTMPILTVM